MESIVADGSAEDATKTAGGTTVAVVDKADSQEHAIMQLPVVREMADYYKLDPRTFVYTFRTVAMPPNHNNAELVSCLMVAHAHGLNPLTKEIYFMKARNGSIQPIVSVDGWAKKCNEHPQFDGLDFVDVLTDNGEPISTTCIIFRKDRTRPVKVTEYFDECSKAGGPAWKITPKRMMRHRALTQCARYAFGFAGVMDRDEFDQWQAAQHAGQTGAQSVERVAKPQPQRVASIADLPDIPDVPDVQQDAPEVLDADDEVPMQDQAALLREIERKLEAEPHRAAEIESEYQTVIIDMDEDGRTAIIEAVQEAKRIAAVAAKAAKTKTK